LYTLPVSGSAAVIGGSLAVAPFAYSGLSSVRYAIVFVIGLLFAAIFARRGRWVARDWNVPVDELDCSFVRVIDRSCVEGSRSDDSPGRDAQSGEEFSK
jgi:hypothetical protein